VRTERQVRVFVRRQRREHDPRRLSDRLIDIYTWFLATVVAGIVISPSIKGDLVPHPTAFLDLLGWLPLVLLVAGWSVLRYATWLGPVLFTTPELQWEVSSPLDRRELVLAKMKRTSFIALGAGVVSGAVVAIGAAAMLRENAIRVSIAAVGTFTALALMTVALSWHVERSSTWNRAVGLAGPAMVAVEVLIAFALVRGLNTAVVWSGPWGWASGPVLVEAGRSVTGWVVQAGLLGVSAIVAMVAAVATADHIDEEELWQRSEARSSASAALFFGDVRAAKIVARQGRTGGRVRGRSLRMMRPSQPWLAIPARDLLTFRRNPGLLGVAGSFVAAAMIAGINAPARPILTAGVFVGIYAGASRLLEPLRLEKDRPDAHRTLPWSWGTVLTMHCIVPTLILTVLVWVGLIGVRVGKLVAPAAMWQLFVLTPFVAGAFVLPAAISASRRAFPMEMLVSGAEQGALTLVTWLLTGPTLALIAVGVAVGPLLPHIDQGVTAATFKAIVFLAVAALVFGGWLSTRKPRGS
jgi:hypothetical protein